MLRRFAMAVAARNERLVIVHGGGVEITRMQERLRIQPRYVDGLRITNAESLALVEMVLCGSVNKLVVRHLVNAGVDALGMSGVDRGLVRAEKMRHEALDMGFTGAVASVQCEKLRDLLEIGITPVLAPGMLWRGLKFQCQCRSSHGRFGGGDQRQQRRFHLQCAGRPG